MAKECLYVGMEAAKPFGYVGDIGNAIQQHAHKNGFSVVRDLCGHGVGVKFHDDPEALHYGKKGTGMLLVPGMVFTIEPMINMGTWKVLDRHHRGRAALSPVGAHLPDDRDGSGDFDALIESL